MQYESLPDKEYAAHPPTAAERHEAETLGPAAAVTTRKRASVESVRRHPSHAHRTPGPRELALIIKYRPGEEVTSPERQKIEEPRQLHASQMRRRPPLRLPQFPPLVCQIYDPSPARTQVYFADEPESTRSLHLPGERAGNSGFYTRAPQQNT